MRIALLSRLDPWLPPLLLMGVIFAFSAQPNLDSGLGAIDEVGRKVIHAAEYALLCFLWWRALAGELGRGRAIPVAFLVSVAYAVTDEYHQTFVTGRSGSAVDVAIDAAGAGVAALALSRRSRPARTR